MKKILAAIAAVALTMYPSICLASYIIHLKNGREFVTERYWEEGEQIKFKKYGGYSLNRLSGSLYIKDTPAVIKSIAKLINHFKEMLSRQILIEARIIEVSLSDGYRYGIDWSLLRKEAKTATKVNEASWALGTGLIISGVRKAFTIDTAIDALRTFGDAKIVSNPSIRSKHGKPSIISVGTSYTYKKSVETTSTFEETTRETTDVEVSTVFDGLILGVILKLANFPFIFFVPAYVSILGRGTPLQFTLIAFAGPLMNCIIWIASIIILKYNLVNRKYFPIIHLTKQINMFLFIFNMLPIPGFDGSKVFGGLIQAFL